MSVNNSMLYGTPRRMLGENEKPLYKCGVPECEERAWEIEDHKPCESCGVRFCSTCMVAAECCDNHTLYFCPTCAKCEYCGASTSILCDRCGNLICSAHNREFHDEDASTGYRESGICCSPKCDFLLAPAEVAEAGESAEEAIPW